MFEDMIGNSGHILWQEKKYTFIPCINFTNNKNLKIPRSLQHTYYYALQSLTTTTTILTTINNTSTANSFYFIILIISNSFIGFMSLAKVMNPILICLGITDAPVSYEYIILQATVNNFRCLSNNVVEIKLNMLFMHL